jgi:hypothetical protein
VPAPERNQRRPDRVGLKSYEEAGGAVRRDPFQTGRGEQSDPENNRPRRDDDNFLIIRPEQANCTATIRGKRTLRINLSVGMCGSFGQTRHKAYRYASTIRSC